MKATSINTQMAVIETPRETPRANDGFLCWDEGMDEGMEEGVEEETEEGVEEGM